MDKSTKQIRSKYNSNITKSLADKYKISERYVRMIISNERSPDFQEEIINDYNKMIIGNL